MLKTTIIAPTLHNLIANNTRTLLIMAHTMSKTTANFGHITPLKRCHRGKLATKIALYCKKLSSINQHLTGKSDKKKKKYFAGKKKHCTFALAFREIEGV